MHPTEDTWTAPHRVCPRPELWHAPDSESTECEVSELIAGLVRALQPEFVLETGTAFGFTTLLIARALKRNKHGYCISLDIDAYRCVQARQRLLSAGVSDWATVRGESSLEYVPPGTIGFALFDSMYELRRLEFLRYRELGCLPAGTIVAFHDWTSGIRGHYLDVRAEVELLHTAGALRPVYLPTPRGLVIAEVI